jgi:hypothetical protein
VSVGDQVVFRACPAPVDWRRACVLPPLFLGSGRGRSRPRTGTSPTARPRSAPLAGPRAVAARLRPRSSPAADASTSRPSQNRGPLAGTPTGSRCVARTGSRTAHPGPEAPCGPGSESVAHAAAAAAPNGSTAHPTRPTAMSLRRTERSTAAPDTVIRTNSPHCVSPCKPHFTHLA